jgi:hypothetical protein
MASGFNGAKADDRIGRDLGPDISYLISESH